MEVFYAIQNLHEKICILHVKTKTRNEITIFLQEKKKGIAVDRRTKGQIEMLYETRFWKNFIGFTCTYAIEYLDDVVFVPGM